MLGRVGGESNERVGEGILRGMSGPCEQHTRMDTHQHDQTEASRAEAVEQREGALRLHASGLSARASAVSMRLMVPATP